ncbi:tRNA pseudouridine38-40 synthase [Andreprevotia lacus DSM 23236]|jgi:tRNA pseudouridine38-40 synthase|uniref:tRNA pseudouridine synthase A n=1 Tax=Andreprevotia lacus DSM 23236 TaxID=1121001 RepID=A0A1W1XIN9_9NEIS|nr:tRNA pseudouridine(38-40) synthase TruA [Andreprevotia lacus]SMC23634.1 tRNA pseudouridine38-40 synthase [Andreprevotia lacus DSM 23236]
MTRYALALEYDGRAFSGWQVQPDRVTVQGALERALSQMAGAPVRAHAAGRTDAGVHASRQIVHFDTDANRSLTAWVRGVNSFLPEGVAVLWAREVPEHFHSRFVATARHYRYLLLNHPVRPGLLAGRVGWAHQQLDLDALRAAIPHLLGTHDFSSFRAAECQAKSPVKTLSRLDMRVDGQMIYFDFSADAFLHHMVRNLMGALLHVARGNEAPEWMAGLVAAQNRSVAPPTFMPDGLYLAGVSYPAEFGLSTEPEPRYGLI